MRAGVATSELVELPDLGAPEPAAGPTPRRRSLPAALLAAIRPRQAITKNLLVFTALIFARRPQEGAAPISLFDLVPLAQALAAYLLFSMTSAAGLVR